MNRSTPGLPVHHQLPEFTQTHVHRVSDAIQPSHPLSPLKQGEKKIVLFDNNILLLLQSCRGIPADNLVHMLRPHRGGEIKGKRSVPPSGMALGEEQP